MSTEYRWEWTLAGGMRVAATLDPSMTLESVLVDGELVSRAERGTKPEGHALSLPAGAVVTFERAFPVCILRVSDVEVPPDVWPTRKRSERSRPSTMSLPLGRIAIALVVALACVAAARAWLGRGASQAPAQTSSSHRSDDGRFVAHFPVSFTARRAVTPPGSSGVVLEDPDRAEAIIVLSVSASGMPHEPWLLQQKLHDEALANLARAGKDREQIGREDDRCIGERGAVVRERAVAASGRPTTIWTCAFFHGDAGYLTMIAEPTSATAEDDRRLRAIVEATELTNLGSLGGAAR